MIMIPHSGAATASYGFLFLTFRATRCYYTFAPHHQPASFLAFVASHFPYFLCLSYSIAFVYLHSIVSYERYIIIYALPPPRFLSHLPCRIAYCPPHSTSACMLLHIARAFSIPS